MNKKLKDAIKINQKRNLKRKRCPNGSRKNPKTGNCEKK